jgi:hypothetical protein
VAAGNTGKQRAAPANGGSFLAIPDIQGIFLRGAGGNAFKKAANNTPYDGGEIGRYFADQMQRLTGVMGGPTIGDVLSSWFGNAFYEGAFFPHYFGVYSAVAQNAGTTLDNAGMGLKFDSSYSPGARTGAYTAPASVSVFPCISY